MFKTRNHSPYRGSNPELIEINHELHCYHCYDYLASQTAVCSHTEILIRTAHGELIFIMKGSGRGQGGSGGG
jgi:hypothetical protein